MLTVPLHITRRYEAVLESKAVSASYRSFYKKWLRYYLDFCQKYAFEPSDSNSLPRFIDKLRQKKQSDALRKQAFHAVTLYYEMITDAGRGGAITQGSAEEPPGHVVGDVKKRGPHDMPLNNPGGMVSLTGTAEAREPRAGDTRGKTEARN